LLNLILSLFDDFSEFFGLGSHEFLVLRDAHGLGDNALHHQFVGNIGALERAAFNRHPL
jgi:hypothetical protein